MIKLGILNPNHYKNTLESEKHTGALLVAEEVCEEGCIGGRILERAEINNILIDRKLLINLGNGIVTHGDACELRRHYRLDAASVARKAEKLLKG